MHEVGIMESALGIVQEQASAQHATRVDRLVIRIGALAGVDVEALRFAFQAVSPGTIAQGATLDVEWLPAVAYCAACRAEFEGGGNAIFACPRCHAFCGDVRQGRELELSRIEMR